MLSANVTGPTPSLFEMRKIVDRHPDCNLFPVFKEFNADLLSPVLAFLKVRRTNEDGQNWSFLLESVEGGERIARYSFIGTEPYKILRQDNEGDPLVKIEEEMNRYKICSFTGRGLPGFTGGGVGYIGYECVKYFEPTVSFDHQTNPIGIPESIFMFCRSLVVFDHVKHSIKVISHCLVHSEQASDNELGQLYSAAVQRIETLIDRLSAPTPPEPPKPLVPNTENWSINVGKDGYVHMVNKLKEHIVKGDIIQAVPSQRIKRKLNNVSAFDIYRQLRVINPSPYLFYLDLDDFQVVGASPELLVKVEHGVVTNHPIAGTRKRGVTPEEDEALKQELLASEKERAEHIMLVDLGRNDVGRVSAPGTVSVDRLMIVEKYSHVMHIVSNVTGKLKKGLSPYDAFRAVFPAGTVSGAPKIRAMQLVSGLESENRVVYAGAVGYISFEGVMDTCISIRTLVVRDEYAYLQAGGGIVYDSVGEEEREESINKMKALERAITVAEKVALDVHKAGEQKIAEQKHVPENDQEQVPSPFGKFGGRYVSEVLVPPLEELERAYIDAMKDKDFHKELVALGKSYVGRPTPLYFAKRLTEHCGSARIWLKREDLAHTGAHKINNALGLCLLAKRMGKKRIIAETGAGQHGVATATACALLNLKCEVYMGEVDMKRQQLNVFRMRMLGAKVTPVTSGSKTLKDAVTEAIRDWVTNVLDTVYIIGSVVGPHPYPTIVRDFQSVIGLEIKRQMFDQSGKLPDVCVACVGGGSNAIGMFYPFIGNKSVRLIGVEAAGCGVETDKHAASITGGRVGVLHGMKTYVLQDNAGQIDETHSISAGLDYPGVGPEHSYLKDCGRAEYVSATDEQSLEGMIALTRLEGIIPALESAHAIYYGMKLAETLPQDQDIVICLSGRGEKDMDQVSKLLNEEEMGKYLSRANITEP